MARRMAKCHPEEFNHGHGYCKRCYNRTLRMNDPKYREAKLRSTQEWRDRNREQIRLEQRNRLASDPEYAAKRLHQGRDWYRRNKELVGEQYLIKTWDLTPEDLRTLEESQGGKCAICGVDSAEAPKGKLHIDHCHATGLVRALLCAKCNMGLGMFGDDPDLLHRASEYVRRYNVSNQESI